MDLSIIIVSWNSEERLRRSLKAIFSETSDLKFEVIVVDNASKDRSLQVAMNEFNGVRIIPNDTNRGFAAAVNQGIKVSSGRYVCLLNPDTEVKDRALEHMVEWMDRSSDIGILGPHLINEDGSTQASVRRFPTGLDQALILMKLHLLFPDANALARYFMRGFDYSQSQDVDQVMGACFMIRREVIDQVGIFDETFFIWFEEVDYCKRVKDRSSYRVAYHAAAHVMHVGGDSFKKVPTGKKRRWYAKSVRYYFRKHKRYGAYIALQLLRPAGFLTGLIVSLFARTKRGRQAEIAAAKQRKHSV